VMRDRCWPMMSIGKTVGVVAIASCWSLEVDRARPRYSLVQLSFLLRWAG
jgi:hypothetical protein